MSMHAIAHVGCTDTVRLRESALKVDSGRKIPGHIRDSNLCQYCISFSVGYSSHWAIWPYRGAGIAHCSNPCRSGGRIFFSRVNFLCWLLFWYPFHPRVTAVARKRSRSSCQKCRWQVTAKHAYTLHMWLCMKWHSAWLYGVHRTRRDGSRFMWHQPCQHCKYTTSVDIKKRAIKKAIHSCRITFERSESALERRIALYKSNHHHHHKSFSHH